MDQSIYTETSEIKLGNIQFENIGTKNVIYFRVLFRFGNKILREKKCS